ncbi:hypothetical protein pb186bvf_018137 [Paramecium bursaria]
MAEFIGQDIIGAYINEIQSMLHFIKLKKMNQEIGLKFLKIHFPFQHLSIYYGHSKILLLKKEYIRGLVSNKEIQTFSNQKRTSILSTRFYTSLRQLTQHPNQDNLSERDKIYDLRVDYWLKKSLSQVMGQSITQRHYDTMEKLLGLIITQRDSQAIRNQLIFILPLFDVFQDFRFINIYLAYLKHMHLIKVWDEYLISSLGHQQGVFQKQLERFFNNNKVKVYELGMICEQIFRDDWFTNNLTNNLDIYHYQTQHSQKRAFNIRMTILLICSIQKVINNQIFWRQNIRYNIKNDQSQLRNVLIILIIRLIQIIIRFKSIKANILKYSYFNQYYVGIYGKELSQQRCEYNIIQKSFQYDKGQRQKSKNKQQKYFN